MPIYKITFTDNSTFEGGENINDSKWMDIPDKEILCLEYFISDNTSIVLRGYDAYNHLVEATKAVYGPKGTDFSQKLHNIYVMGRQGNKVISHRIALVGNSGVDKYRHGDITKRQLEFGKEFRGKPTVNWKRGIV